MKGFLTHQDGLIKRTSYLGDGDIQFDEKATRAAYPDEELIEIDQETYKKIKPDLFKFKVKDKKVVERSQTDFEKITEPRRKGQDNTPEKVLERLEKLERAFTDKVK